MIKTPDYYLTYFRDQVRDELDGLPVSVVSVRLEQRSDLAHAVVPFASVTINGDLWLWNCNSAIRLEEFDFVNGQKALESVLDKWADRVRSGVWTILEQSPDTDMTARYCAAMGKSRLPAPDRSKD